MKEEGERERKEGRSWGSEGEREGEERKVREKELGE